ncbi:MAG TPA: hypothetical protein VFR47_09510 [Anaerolineales bacterium]|nr:hypothetical protein [Anaerolineales bacterium]
MAHSTFPQIREFQGAPRKLLREYIAAIDVAASLPFFVNISRLLAPNENEDTYSRLNRKFFALFAPLTKTSEFHFGSFDYQTIQLRD